jgi:hypothetical protein
MRSLRDVLYALIVPCLVAIFACSATAAQPRARGATLRIAVQEQLSRAPIGTAHVRLVGDRLRFDGFTARAGTVVFENVPPAAYGLDVSADGYTFASQHVDVPADRGTLALTAFGERTGPRRIGSVGSRSTPPPSAASSRQDGDAASEIAGGVGPALARIPALASGATGDLLVHGHDATTTAVTINGAPVFPSGLRNQLSLVGNDIFSSGALGPGTIGAPDGTLALQTYDPTIDWMGLAQARGASFGSQSGSIQERGSAGRLGIAYTHAYNDVSSPLDGRYYADTSGSAYYHDAVQRAAADALTVRYGFAPGHAAYLDLGRLSDRVPAICTQKFGTLPCGYGPGNAQADDVSYVQLRDRLELDRFSLDLHAFGSAGRTAYDDAGRTAFGRDAGFTSSVDQRRSGYIATLKYSYSLSRAVGLSISSVADSSVTRGPFGNTGVLAPLAADVARNVRLDVPLFDRSRFHSSLSAGREWSSGGARSTAGLAASFQATNRDTVSASYQSGAAGTASGSFNGVGPVSAASIDCAGANALAQGPALGSPAPTTTQTRLGFTHTGPRLSFDVSAFRDVDRNALVSALVPASALAPGSLAADYLSQLSDAAAGACGHATAIGSDRLFLSVSGPAARVVNDGVDLGLRGDLGARAHLDLAFSLSRSRAFGADPLLFAHGSTLASGAQRPDVPSQRAELGLRYALSRSATLLAELSYFGAGNPYRGHPFAALDVGARFKTQAADVVVGLQNALGTASGDFGTFDPFPHVSRPFTPRTLSVRYRIALGRHGIDRAQYLSTPGRAGAQMFFVPKDFEPAVRDWLEPATDEGACGPESLPAAKRYLDAIREFAAAVEAAQRSGRHAESVPPAEVAGMRLSASSDGSPYTIKLNLDLHMRRALIPFIGCAAIHVGSYDTALALRLFVPGWEQRQAEGASALYYAPQAGLYYPPPAVNATGVRALPSKGLPATPPHDPFRVVDEACPATYRDAVQETLSAFRGYADAVYRGVRAQPPDGLSVVRHSAKSEDWLELRAADDAFGNALAICVAAPVVAKGELSLRGLGGAVPPSVDYAPSVGFYRALP